MQAALSAAARRRRARLRSWALQAAVAAACLLLAFAVARNVIANLRARGLASGFDFLGSEAGFRISFSLIPFPASSTYGRAFLVGVLNTLLVAAVAIVLATILGAMLGILRSVRGSPGARLALLYVETIRNVPLLLQVLLWQAIVINLLPVVRQSITLGGWVFLNNRGLVLPDLRLDGLAVHLSRPVLAGFNFRGGVVLPPEFVSLVTAIALYNAAYVAEIVRSGIESVGRGQREAAAALGLSPPQAMRFVIFPQALRLAIPPLAGQYAQIVKASSLATVIGYPDLMNVFLGATLNQTGRAIEVVAITMAVYLAISAAIAAFTTWFNEHLARKGAVR